MPGAGYHYRVVRNVWGLSRAEVSLVREQRRHGLRAKLHKRDAGELVLFKRAFKPRIQLNEMERYARELDRVAEHGNAGTLGCFVDTTSYDGRVQTTLYERWFDGSRLRCDELASRVFDPADDDALVNSAEFVAQLEVWAEEQNVERQQRYLDARSASLAREERVLDQAAAANELASILSNVSRHS